MVNIALKSVNKPYSQKCVDYAISRFEAYYIDNGWYCDGERPQKDYYVSFAIHFYCLIYSQYMQDCDAQRCKVYVKRAKKFAETFIYWFDDEGKAFKKWRSAVWTKSYEILNAVLDGEREIPTEEELLSELPKLTIDYTTN